MHFLGLGSNVLASVYLNGAFWGKIPVAFDVGDAGAGLGERRPQHFVLWHCKTPMAPAGC